MSTTNTEILTLYKNPKLYNGSRYKVFQDGIDYDQWLLDNSDSAVYQETVYFKGLNNPITINKAIKDCDEFTYGSITNEGKKYYIFIDGITTNAYNQTEISFSVDWWSSKWDNVQCTKAQLMRKPTKPGYMPQPYTPMKPSVEIKEDLGKNKGCVLFSFIKSVSSDDYMSFGVVDIKDVGGFMGIESGQWSQKLDIPASDILSCFIVPFFDRDDFYEWELVEVTDKVPYRTSGKNGSSFTPTIRIEPNELITSDEQNVFGICDWNGNTVWECPYGVEIDAFDVELNISPDTCFLRFVYSGQYVNEIVGKGFTYDCKKVSIFINQELEYTWRERQAEIWMRRIQSNKQVWTNISDAIQGTGFGFAFGGPEGAMAALGGGILNVLSTWEMNQIYDPEIQKATDLRYQDMKDEMSVIGNSITPLYNYIKMDNIFHLGFYVGEMPSADDETDLINDYISDYVDDPYTIEVGDLAYCYPLYFYKDHIYEHDYPKDTHFIENHDIYIYNSEHKWVKTSDTFVVHYKFDSDVDSEWSDATDFEETFGKSPDYKTLYVKPTGRKKDGDIENASDMSYVYDGTQWITVAESFVGHMSTTPPDDYLALKYYKLQISHSDKIALMFVYKLMMDSDTKNRMDKDIEVNGYYCDEFTDNLQNLFAKDNILQANNIIVEGNLTLEGKQQIVYRLQKGVEFI